MAQRKKKLLIYNRIFLKNNIKISKRKKYFPIISHPSTNRLDPLGYSEVETSNFLLFKLGYKF